jgi:hypothetical protein
MNSSCNPNCSCEKWTVGSDERIAIIAKRNILEDEELTIDYRLQSFGKDEPCLCGADNCKNKRKRRRPAPTSVLVAATTPKKRVRRRTESREDLVVR